MSETCALTGIILAGGKSKRFGGGDKALERIGHDRLIERVVYRLPSLSEHIVVTNETLVPQLDLDLSGTRVIMDVIAGQGPLGGIHARPAGGFQPLFAGRGLLRYMLSVRFGYDGVIPRILGMLELLHAVYSKDCLPAIERCLYEGRRVACSFLDGVRVRFVEQNEVERFDTRHLSFFNINDPGDMDTAGELVGGMTSDLTTAPATTGKGRNRR